MKSGLVIFSLITITIALVAIWFRSAGLPLNGTVVPELTMVGSVNDVAVDPKRLEFFGTGENRVVPFQILYPASKPGTPVSYVPDAEPVTIAIERNQGWMVGTALRRIGKITALWTEKAPPKMGGHFPVVLYLPGVTGYMQMSSFQTVALASDGFVVVTLNQPGVVAAAVLPNGQVVEGMSRELAVQLIAPSYRTSQLSRIQAAQLKPEQSIVPYLGADVPLVLDRLDTINADPNHPLYGLLDLQRIGIMGISLGAIVAAQACLDYDRVKACLMMDAPVPTAVAKAGLQKPALWLSRPASDQRLERKASGGWPELEITAQADSIALTISNSSDASVVELNGLFHIDFTDLPTIQPLFGWLGLAGAIGTKASHEKISKLTLNFFDKMKSKDD